VTASGLVVRVPGRSVTSRIVIERGGLDRLGARVRVAGLRRVALVSEPNVAALYAPRALSSLARAGVAAQLVCVPHGERAKAARHLAALWDAFAAFGLGRESGVVALGGGVVGDVAGFAAATWLRGVAWIGVPTSLLAQVDSSVGGKTAIDLPAGKNLAGAFHQPRLVVIDPALLATLPARHRRAGLAEVVKMGGATDGALFGWCERNAAALAEGDTAALGEAVLRSIRAKARIVRADEREREGGPRTALNLGHTLAHALEAALGYRRLLHGEAVAIGVRVAVRLSAEVGSLPVGEADRAIALLDRLGLAKGIPDVPVARLVEYMRVDKKSRNGKIRWVLTPRLGHASVPRLIPGRRVESVLVEAGARR